MDERVHQPQHIVTKTARLSEGKVDGNGASLTFHYRYLHEQPVNAFQIYAGMHVNFK